MPWIFAFESESGHSCLVPTGLEQLVPTHITHIPTLVLIPTSTGLRVDFAYVPRVPQVFWVSRDLLVLKEPESVTHWDCTLLGTENFWDTVSTFIFKISFFLWFWSPRVNKYSLPWNMLRITPTIHWSLFRDLLPTSWVIILLFIQRWGDRQYQLSTNWMLACILPCPIFTVSGLTGVLRPCYHQFLRAPSPFSRENGYSHSSVPSVPHLQPEPVEENIWEKRSKGWQRCYTSYKSFFIIPRWGLFPWKMTLGVSSSWCSILQIYFRSHLRRSWSSIINSWTFCTHLLLLMWHFLLMMLY